MPEAPLLRGMPTGPEAFLEPLAVSGLRLCARTCIKKLCATLVRSVGRILLPAVLTLLFSIYVLFFNTLVPSTLSSFWPQTGHNRNWISPDNSTNNAIRTNYVKAKIAVTQQNNKVGYVVIESKRNHKIRERSKLAQKEYKTRHEWIGKVIHWELCKELKFNHKNIWYLHNLASVLENETHKLLWNF